MIVIEGFDASGKSTLAKMIGNFLEWPVLHTGGPTRNEIDVITCLRRSVERMGRRVVQDRITHISESVYSMTTHPRKAALALNAINRLPAEVMFIYCRPPTEFILEAHRLEHKRKDWDTDEHMARVLDTADTLIEIYDTVMALVALRCDVFHHDRSNPADINTIREHVRKRFL